MRALRSIEKTLRGLFNYIAFPFEPACDPQSLQYQKLESTVPAYTLPDPLLSSDGSRVTDASTWRLRRRPEILELFRTHVYGCTPNVPPCTPFSGTTVDRSALGGLATRKEVRVGLAGVSDGPWMPLLLYLPNSPILRRKRVPLFLGLNFFGNHTIHDDRGISVGLGWIPDNSITEGRPQSELRGVQSSSWPVEFILRRGYGLATAYCGDIVPDRTDGLELGVHRWLDVNGLGGRMADSWGAIGGWAWGLSRAMDYLEQDEEIAADNVALIGHSRLGKAALWAGAQDERFAMVISNESGCAGASLSRRHFGETVAQINSAFPHWFCDNFKQYGERENLLPVDQHQLLSLIAPRPVYVASAQKDLHADPMGEFLAAKHASPVYRLLGTDGLPAEELPPPNAPVMGSIGYHIRKGGHGITLFDWTQFLAFADKHFKCSAQ